MVGTLRTTEATMRDDTPAGMRAAQSWGQGRWFPADARQLATTVDRFVESAVVPAIPGRLVATVAPHAGYAYSGAVAGHTFRAMRDMAREAPPEVVVVLGFCHRASFPGIALLEGAAMRTPLGLALLDPALGEALVAASDVYHEDSEAHVGEHSAENQIPFLQRALPGVRLVVGLFGEADPIVVAEAVRGLREAGAGRRLALVASTDLLHDADYERVCRTDRETLALIGALDAEALWQSWNPRDPCCCGIGPVLAALAWARAEGCRDGQLLCYRNSGDDHPETRGEWVVGYGAVAFAADA